MEDQIQSKPNGKKIKMAATAGAAIILGIALFLAGTFSSMAGKVLSFSKGESYGAPASKNILDTAPETGIVDAADAVTPKIDLGVISDAGLAYQPPKEGKAVLADLDSMKLYMYEDAVEVDSADILSKGKPGSFWETPTGNYKILDKEENHYSTIGGVWMPWSMHFFGNFFIHGWPYEDDGSPVPKGYSGGCIRLSTEDAEKIYQFVKNGTPVSVFNGTRKSVIINGDETPWVYTLKAGQGINPSAESYLVADVDTGQILFEKNHQKAMPIASISKLMTALISLETINQYKETTISRDSYDTYGTAGELYPGQKILIGNLIYPMLLESSNDAAEALAEFSGRSVFIKQMNEKARAIGLANTSFEDPSGLSSHNVSSAEDLFKLAQYIFKNKRYIFDVTKKQQQKTDDGTWHATLPFYQDKRYVGGKNGYTDEAGKTLLVVFSLPITEFQNRNLAIILLNAQNSNKEAFSIVDYLQKNLSYAPKDSAMPITAGESASTTALNQ